ncbi:MAG TPA: hypothetical protein VFV67_04970 [Actinophytocola sp.]|uniref:hypothetical protein n=1 Tax=Actinophytocola sp. TaxID=1872138 RepID=UPI002DB6F3BE|nr:hypothetical protein [Actinophytocola sp.]HEU5469983.1 hypothetical protein [Actinophytocola sp.]
MILTVLLGAAFTVFAIPSAAQADPIIDIVCVGVEEATFDPGLRLFEQDVDITSHIDYEECVSATIDSGTTDSGGEDIPLSCLSILFSSSGTWEIVWNTTDTSTFEFDYTVSQSGGQTIMTLIGTITAGEFTGSDAVMTLTGGSITQNCLFAPGVTENTSAVSLTISH